MSFAEFYIELYYFEPEEFLNTLAKLRKVFSESTDAKITIKDFEQGPPFQSPIQIFITGDDLSILRRISSDVEAMLSKQEGVINLENMFVKRHVEGLPELP